ncbi:MAG TPA: radical SAM protein [Flavobacterium sp.]
MQPTILSITPPFTQLNTPYPATAYLKGFLNTKGIVSVQADLGIEVILQIFSRAGLAEIFSQAEKFSGEMEANIHRILTLKDDYLSTIDNVILFLQGMNPTLALQICQRGFLPEASRFAPLDDLEWAFGTMGLQDKAKHMATLYLEDISDLIVSCVDNNFGFSRYAERLGRSASSFDELYVSLKSEPSYIDTILFRILAEKMAITAPDLLLISVPFPGNLYSAFRTAQWVKANFQDTKIAMGGGFPNTELRSLSDKRVFEFIDFITLDDGERPVENLIEFISGKREVHNLKRTFTLIDGVVVYINSSSEPDYKQSETGTPDYSDLPLDKYISVIEIVNPMHRMWSDGRWNKLTMAHGCYWGKCTFCDISLDYIKVYEPVAASLLCDRMEALMHQTGQNGFHFVDEAAPPALMRALAIEIIRRRLSVTWWTNIRFEKSFTRDLCFLLRASGCIAVSGGLEVASDRLLNLIDKGVTVEQVAVVTKNFTECGIMVHAYLMYGYPTQTIQETVDSLEMVRQMFEAGILQSGFWHQFAMTAHSPVGMYPERFGVLKDTDIVGTFANNDINYTDSTGIDHDIFSFGLKKSLFNFMHGVCFDYPLQEWFDFRIPKTSIKKDYITSCISADTALILKGSSKIIWTRGKPFTVAFVKSKKGQSWEMLRLTFHNRQESFEITLEKDKGSWLLELLEKVSVYNKNISTLSEIKASFEMNFDDFEIFWFSKPIQILKEKGLLSL